MTEQWPTEALRAYVDAKLIDVEGQLDRRIITQQRELADAVRHLENAIPAGDDEVMGRIEELHRIRASDDVLERERVTRLDQSIASVKQEMILISEASDRAIIKSEIATEKRFDAVNEFRAQLADQSSTFLPREVADAQFGDIRKRLDQATERINIEAGAHSHQEQRREIGNRWAIAIMGVIVTVVVVLVNVGVAVL